MKKDVFTPADILLPADIEFEKWSVIACDQFSSELDYWDRVRSKVGTEPSTLNMIIPEAYLNEIDMDKEVKAISTAMDRYTDTGLFREVRNSFVYIERTLSDGRLRRGLIGTVDLDQYDFSGSDAAILASEGTVLDRLPARVHVRRSARLELPHIMAFIDDYDMTVIEPLSKRAGNLPLLYDFDLMEGGGRIRGLRVSGDDADGVMSAMRELHKKNDTLMVMGDGNHSLAAAKLYWDDIKRELSTAERSTHPAGKALLEVNNIYDPAICFEAIHRVVFDADYTEFLSAFENAMQAGSSYELRWISRGKSGVIGVKADCIGDMLTDMQMFFDEYINRTGCCVDYIHDADAVERLAQGERCLGLVLPAMDKSELFATVVSRGVFPKKSFSVGHARDKRYYLECRSINNVETIK